MSEDDASRQSPNSYEQAKAELQHHTEYLFRKAGDSPEAKRLRLSLLNYRLAALQNSEMDKEPEK